jgi:hypothetical protein
MSITHE